MANRFLASNPAAKQAFDRRIREAEAKAAAKVNVLLLREQQKEAQITKMAAALGYCRRMPASCSLEARLTREFA